MRKSGLLGLACATFPFVVGCTNDVEERLPPEASASELAAFVSIDSTSYANGEVAPHATSVARFVRTSEGAVDRATLDMLGASLDLPPLGTCAEPSIAIDAPERVELVDLGNVTVVANGKATELLPRFVPDVTDLVSGVVYGARSDGDDAPVDGWLSLRVSGTSAVEPIAIDVLDVGAPRDVAFDGAPFDTSAPLVLAAGTDHLVSWSDARTGDIVWFEVHGGGAAPVTCAYEDLGTATIPRDAFARAGGNITVHRVHRESIAARGVDEGEARLDFARVYPLGAADLSP